MMRPSLAALLPVFLVFQGEGTWKDNAPSTSGWRAVQRGMSVEEVLAALPDDAVRDKDQKYSDGSVHARVKLRKKVKLDRVDYEVSVRFDSTGHVDQLGFFSNKVKKETMGEVAMVLTEVYGPPTTDETKRTPSMNTRGDEVMRTVHWQKDGAAVYLTGAESPLGPFVTGRLVSLTMNFR